MENWLEESPYGFMETNVFKIKYLEVNIFLGIGKVLDIHNKEKGLS